MIILLKRYRMSKYYFITIVLLFLNYNSISQNILEANGPGNTYELINSYLAPGYDAIEEPDCNHQSFGRHIDEVFDITLNKYVFRFHIHKFPDNDRCVKFDRQRNEIKAYNQSPDSMLGVLNELIEYNWKFKLDSGFMPSFSFTHIHQLKAVGGPEESIPLITLTARKGNPDKLELRYADSLIQSTIYQENLNQFKGIWVEVKERVFYNEVGLGEYEILITKFSNNDTLFHYKNNSLRTWKTNATFIRPKWGIYRSLSDSSNLRDEEILYADFSIREIQNPLTIKTTNSKSNNLYVYPNPVTNGWLIIDDFQSMYNNVYIYNITGQLILNEKITAKKINLSHLEPGIYFAIFYSKNNQESRKIKVIIQR